MKKTALKAVPKKTTAEIDRGDALDKNLEEVQAVLVALNMASESAGVPEPFASALMILTRQALDGMKKIKALVEVTA